MGAATAGGAAGALRRPLTGVEGAGADQGDGRRAARRVATGLVRWLGRRFNEPKIALDGYGVFDLADDDHCAQLVQEWLTDRDDADAAFSAPLPRTASSRTIRSAAMTSYHVHYQGPARLVGYLGQLLEEQGVEASWEQPLEERGGEFARDVAVIVVAMGSYDAIKAAVAKAREKFPGIGLTIEEGNE